MRQIKFANRSLLGFASFNLGWWACALGARQEMDWLGPALMPLWVGLHVYFSPTRLGEAIFVVSLGGIGFLIDSALLHTGLFQIEGAAYAPLWLVCMWVLLGLNFEGMLTMRRNFGLVILLGLLNGPLCYLYAQAAKILTYAEPVPLNIALHGLVWAALMPLLFTWRDFILRRALPHRPAESH